MSKELKKPLSKEVYELFSMIRPVEGAEGVTEKLFKKVALDVQDLELELEELKSFRSRGGYG